FATAPCSPGSAPVVNVACTVLVTAGSTVRSGRIPPSRASFERFGVAAPSSFGVSPTTFRTSVRFISPVRPPQPELRRLPQERRRVLVDDPPDQRVIVAAPAHRHDEVRD